MVLWSVRGLGFRGSLVAAWMHFTLLGIMLPINKPKVCTFRGLMNSATKSWEPLTFLG